MDLSNRDIAFLIWLAVLAAFLLTRRDTRESIVGVLRALWGKLMVLFVGFALYIAAVVLVAQRVGAWNTGLLKDTIAWFLVPGLVLLFGFTNAYEGRGYYGRTLLRVIGLTALIEFYVNLGAFPLPVELLLLPGLVFLVAMSAVAALKPDTMIVKRLADGLLGVMGLAILIGTGVYLVREWPNLDKAELVLSFALPIWLTVMTLPFIFLFSLYANYETTFVRIDLATKDDARARRRAKMALLASFHLRNRDLQRFTGMAPSELGTAQSWGEARRIIAYHRAEARVEEAKKDLAAKKLIRYAGVPGTDWKGRPLDQREFEDTKHALDMLATFHQAQFADGRYRTDLMEAVGNLLSSKQLPDPGIVSEVEKNGHSWFAWRRTVTGWCLGIGATGPPPDHWVYEGLEPPSGYPRKDDGWRHGDFDDDSDEE